MLGHLVVHLIRGVSKFLWALMYEKQIKLTAPDPETSRGFTTVTTQVTSKTGIR